MRSPVNAYKPLQCMECKNRFDFTKIQPAQGSDETIKENPVVCPTCKSVEGMKLIKSMWSFRPISTNPGTAQQFYLSSTTSPETMDGLFKGQKYVFVDGSSTGAAAAITLAWSYDDNEDEGAWIEQSHNMSRPSEQPAIRNVAGEMDAVMLALREAGSEKNLTIVSDFLGTALWGSGAWKIKNRDVLARIASMHALIVAKSLKVKFIHHKGHQKDKSVFTTYNNRVDKLVTKLAKAPIEIRPGVYKIQLKQTVCRKCQKPSGYVSSTPDIYWICRACEIKQEEHYDRTRTKTRRVMKVLYEELQEWRQSLTLLNPIWAYIQRADRYGENRIHDDAYVALKIGELHNSLTVLCAKLSKQDRQDILKSAIAAALALRANEGQKQELKKRIKQALKNPNTKKEKQNA